MALIPKLGLTKAWTHYELSFCFTFSSVVRCLQKSSLPSGLWCYLMMFLFLVR